MPRFNRSILLTLVATLWGCTPHDSLEAIQSSGELSVISRNSPSTYYIEAAGPAGFEFALAEMFAEELGVQLDMRPAFSLNSIFEELDRRDADIAAAGLTLTAPRAERYPHSVAYDELVTQVIYKTGYYRPRKPDDLPGMSIVTLAGSSHAASLRELRDNSLPELRWTELDEADTTELLELVATGGAQLALLDSSEFAVQQSLYPRLKAAFDLDKRQKMVWYLPPDADNTRLLERVNAFLTRLREDGTLDELREQHFGHIEGVSRIGSHTFTRMMQTALPPYLDLIKQVAVDFQMDWRLLAAIAYQESHWDPRAESPTGVRGMMMLTRPTAREMGVDNRLDAEQSLRGGARYFKDMKRRLPDDINEPDRTWFALAAYNIGRGHLEDARILTERQGGDPHIWVDVLERLPLLQRKEHYSTLRYGYARGNEAATYVQNIRHYYSILQWQEISENRELPPLKPDDYIPEALKKLQLKSL